MRKVAAINSLNAVITIVNLSYILASTYFLLEQIEKIGTINAIGKLFVFNIVAQLATVLVLLMNSIIFLSNAKKAYRENSLSSIAKSLLFPLVGIRRTISGNKPHAKFLCLLSALSSINLGMLLFIIHQLPLWSNIMKAGDINPTMFACYTKELIYIIRILGILFFLNVISLMLESRRFHRQKTSRKHFDE